MFDKLINIVKNLSLNDYFLFLLMSFVLFLIFSIIYKKYIFISNKNLANEEQIHYEKKRCPPDELSINQ